MPKRMRWVKQIEITIDDLAKAMDLPERDEVHEYNVEYLADAFRHAYREALDDEKSEEDAEEAGLKAEQEAGDELYRNWHDAVEAAANAIFGEHHLELEPKKAGERTPFEYIIEPERGHDWEDAARIIASTMSGYGFGGELAEQMEAQDVGSVQKFVKDNVGWIFRYPEVYGHPNPRRVYESSWR